MVLLCVLIFFACSKDEDAPTLPPEKVITFTNANFKTVLLKNTTLNTNKDNEIQEKEAEAFTGKLNVSGQKLSNLKDLQFFPNITELDCSNNNLTTLDLSKNPKLVTVYCQKNKIKEVATKGQTVVTKSLNLSTNSELKTLNCSYNELKTIDLSGNKKLVNLDCSHNLLENLNVSTNTELSELDCSYNNFPKLDLSSNAKLTKLNASNNSEITELNIANGNNSTLKEMDATNTPKLKMILVDESTVKNPPKDWKKDKDDSYYTEQEDDNAIVNIPDANFKRILLEHGKSIIDEQQQSVTMSKRVGRTETATAIDENYPMGSANMPVQMDAESESAKISVIDTNGDGEIQVGEAKAYTGKIKVETTRDTPEDEKVVDLTGIEAFVNLKVLNCAASYHHDYEKDKWINDGSIENIDITKNTQLEELYCGHNKIKTLDVSNNIALKKLYCFQNKIEKLDVTQHTELTDLSVGQTTLKELLLPNETNTLEYLYYPNSPQIANINISNYTNLRGISCGSNNLNSIDVSIFKELEYLNINNNNISSIDISQNKKLKKLICSSNNLTKLDVSQNTKLYWLSVYKNKLRDIDVSNNLLLWHFSCGANQLKKLDVTKNTELGRLMCEENKLTDLNVQNNSKIFQLFCYQNQLTNLDVSRIEDLRWLWCYENPQLSCIQVSEEQLKNAVQSWWKDEVATYSTDCNGGGETPPVNQTYIELTTEKMVGETIKLTIDAQDKANVWIDLNNNGEKDDNEKVTNFDEAVEYTLGKQTIRIYGYIYDFRCNSNQLTKLDVSHNEGLLFLYCQINNLTNLDVTQNTDLYQLHCANNKLINLNMTKNIELDFLNCEENPLENLDISRNIKLKSLICASNKLNSLNITQNIKLDWFVCNNNQLTNLDVSNCPNLGMRKGGYGFSCKNNPNLTCIKVNQEQLDNMSERDWQKDDTATYSTDCGN